MMWERSYYAFDYGYIIGSRMSLIKVKSFPRALLCYNLNNCLKYKFEENKEYRHCEESDTIIFRKINIE